MLNRTSAWHKASQIASTRVDMDKEHSLKTGIILNPVLPGFHPDPSILRVENDFYIATSTFEWFPGVRISHSRDLRNWRVLTHALTRLGQLDMRGNPRSGGVWAPCLTFAKGLFHLLYSDVKNWGFGFDDCHNYLLTAESIEGHWSDPIYLNSSGFDPSLFTDNDGRQWVVNVIWDHRPGRDSFGGIGLQEYCAERRSLVGKPCRIFGGSARGRTEGPHLYRHGNYYYLMVAEGGTGWEHAVTVARSHKIDGPYEVDPRGSMLTSHGSPKTALQKAGHGSLVQTQTDEWYLAHLCARPVCEHRRCVLGRETAIQRVEWTSEGWPRLADEGIVPRIEVQAPGLAYSPFPPEQQRDHFDGDQLGPHYQTLRVPADNDWLSLSERPSYLRLRGRESPRSLHRQSLVGRRFQSFHCRFETSFEFRPVNFQQMAGLMCLYDDENFYYANISFDDELGINLGVLESSLGKLSNVLDKPVSLADGRAYLRADYHEAVLRFFYSLDGRHWIALTDNLDATILSDEHTTAGLGFTGSFGALCAHDMSGQRAIADFDYFDYIDLDSHPVVMESVPRIGP
jgi:xylan 1,4-beta-xylosidase